MGSGGEGWLCRNRKRRALRRNVTRRGRSKTSLIGRNWQDSVLVEEMPVGEVVE